MENDRGELVDLYVPRKCTMTGALIHPTDHASVQLSIAKLDENGRQIPGELEIIALTGKLGVNTDTSVNTLAKEKGLLKIV